MNNNRWWENYLVRYFLPSIAGVLLLSIIKNINPTGFAAAFPLLEISDATSFNSASLVIWLLSGTLYCYIASYPVLVFHATRPIDFQRKSIDSDAYARSMFNPIFWSAVFFAANWWFFAREETQVTVFEHRLNIFYITTSAYSALQIYRIFLAYTKPHKVRSRNHFYYYAYTLKLSLRRAAAQKMEHKYQAPIKDAVESYKHLREHGNTAITLFIQIAIFPIILNALSEPSYPLIATLIFLWVIPPSILYFTSQMFEFKFSNFTTN